MHDESTYRLMLAALILGAMAIAAPHRYRAEKAGGRVSRRGEGPVILFGLRAVGLVSWLTLFAYLLAPRLVAWAMLPLPAWARISGAALGVPVLAWWYWVFHSLGLNVTDTVAVRERATLVTSGPYRWVRHPLYAGLPLTVLSFGLLAANWVFLLGGGAAMAFLVARTRIEEAELLARFGDDYRAYMRRTGRFFPCLVGRGERRGGPGAFAPERGGR